MKHWVPERRFDLEWVNQPPGRGAGRRKMAIGVLCLAVFTGWAQGAGTDYSLFWQKTGERIDFAESASGDLWKELGHHGPAVENEWAGYRLYFNRLVAMDLYSKATPSIELRKTGWYLPESLKGQGYGTDHYFVGETIGAGSIRLWDSGRVQLLDPVTRRSVRAVTEGSISYFDLRSEGIPYQGRQVDLLLRLTVYAGFRHATLEAFVLAGGPVQFVSGINLNPDLDLVQEAGCLMTWGKHDSRVADRSIDVGTAVIFDPQVIQQTVTRPDEVLVVSRPAHYYKTWITTANELEATMNTFDEFQTYVRALAAKSLVSLVPIED